MVSLYNDGNILSFFILLKSQHNLAFQPIQSNPFSKWVQKNKKVVLPLGGVLATYGAYKWYNQKLKLADRCDSIYHKIIPLSKDANKTFFLPEYPYKTNVASDFQTPLFKFLMLERPEMFNLFLQKPIPEDKNTFFFRFKVLIENERKLVRHRALLMQFIEVKHFPSNEYFLSNVVEALKNPLPISNDLQQDLIQLNKSITNNNLQKFATFASKIGIKNTQIADLSNSLDSVLNTILNNKPLSTQLQKNLQEKSKQQASLLFFNDKNASLQKLNNLDNKFFINKFSDQKNNNWDNEIKQFLIALTDEYSSAKNELTDTALYLNNSIVSTFISPNFIISSFYKNLLTKIYYLNIIHELLDKYTQKTNK